MTHRHTAPGVSYIVSKSPLINIGKYINSYQIYSSNCRRRCQLQFLGICRLIESKVKGADRQGERHKEREREMRTAVKSLVLS